MITSINGNAQINIERQICLVWVGTKIQNYLLSPYRFSFPRLMHS